MHRNAGAGLTFVIRRPCVDHRCCPGFGVRAEEVHFRRRQGGCPGDGRKGGVQLVEDLFYGQVNLVFSKESAECGSSRSVHTAQSSTTMRVCARTSIGRFACPVQRAILGELIADKQTGLRARSFAPQAKYNYMSGKTGPGALSGW